MALGVAGVALGADDSRVAVVGHIEGAINPVTARYVARVVDDAEARGVAAVVFVIDTPGGLIDSTYRITGRFLNARVPIITYVGPAGARAASAGTFITMAGHVAAMAPATNIGAAHPVDSNGADIQGDLRLKAENDAAAQITKIALARGRNAQWAEDAVRKSVSIRDDEALRLNVVDLVATDVRELLDKADGRAVTTAAGATKLATRGATIEDGSPNPFERLLHIVVDPQIAVMLFSLGTLALFFELQNPSLILPGVFGVIAIVLALFAFGTLDASAAGVALLVFAVVLFIADIKVASHGFLTAGGIFALLFGLIILFPPLPTFPGVRTTVDPVLIAVLVGVTTVFFVAVTRMALQAHALFGQAVPIVQPGATGVAKSDIGETGIAYVSGEDWTAVSAGGPIAKGSPVRVRRVDSLRLIVEPAKDTAEGRGAS